MVLNKSERMVKCRLLAPKSYLSPVINSLYELELCHLVPHLKKEKELDLGSPLADAEEISALLVKMRSILSKFDVSAIDKQPGNLNKKDFKSAKNKVNQLYVNFIDNESKIKSSEDEKQRLNYYLEMLQFLKKNKVDLFSLLDSKELTIFFGKVNKVEGIDLAFNNYFYIREKDFFLTIIEKKQEEKVNSLLSGFGFNQFKGGFVFKDLNKELNTKKAEFNKIEKDIKKTEVKLSHFKKEINSFLTLEYQLEEELKKQELPLSFAVTNSSFVAEGWIPEEEQTKVRTELEKVTKNAIEIHFEKPSKKEEPPVKLKNKRLVAPFEFLLKLYDLPNYKEIDPTSLMFITFPLFFGFMLGDVGYGIVLLLLFSYLKKKIPSMQQLIKVMMFAAIVTIFFGLFFGEVFGFEHLGYNVGKSLCDNTGICLHKALHISHGEKTIIWEFPRVINRFHGHLDIFGYEILSVLVIGAIIGFVHLNFGLIFGFISELYSHGFKHAFMAKMSWILIEIGVALIVLKMINILIPFMLWVGIFVAILGVVLLGMGEGIQGLVEIPALFSNMLSYIRLGAVGLASVGLAMVVNKKLAMPFISKGGWFILIGVLLMLLGHSINILLGVIGPFLHGIRLHYVEFFSKFFHGGGIEFEPFARKQIK